MLLAPERRWKSRRKEDGVAAFRKDHLWGWGGCRLATKRKTFSEWNWREGPRGLDKKGPIQIVKILLSSIIS